MVRRAPGRKDANQAAQQRHFEHYGGVTADTSMVKDGFVDWVGIYRGHSVYVESKDGTKPPSARRLTPAEQAFHALWGDAGADVVVWETPEDIDAWIQSKQ